MWDFKEKGLWSKNYYRVFLIFENNLQFTGVKYPFDGLLQFSPSLQ